MTVNKPDNNFMKESMDMRKFFLCIFRKWWAILLTVVIGAVIGVCAYKLYFAITDGDTKYQISSDYFISFNEKDFPNGLDFFNAYTWGQFALDDRIVDYCLDQLDGTVTKEEILASVTTDMPSDYRVLTVIVTGTDIDKITKINDGYKLAMPHFAGDVGELLSIELWSDNAIEVANIHNLTKNAAILGAIIALVLAGFAWAIFYCMDDRIYVEKDWEKISGDIPFLGYDCEPYKEDTDANAKALIKSDKVVWAAGIKEIADGAIDGLVLQIPWGKKHATAIEYDINVLKKQGVNVLGVVLTDCNKAFLKSYYGLKK